MITPISERKTASQSLPFLAETRVWDFGDNLSSCTWSTASGKPHQHWKTAECRDETAPDGIHVQVDPLIAAPGVPTMLRSQVQAYSYASANPLLYVDPTGLLANCTFSQSTGRYFCTDSNTGATLVDNDHAYSGGQGMVNDPNSQNTMGGTIPRGTWDIGTGRADTHLGDPTLPLNPHDDVNLRNRTLVPPFLIHGDNPARNQTASTGCIILDRRDREAIDEAGGGTLTVTR